MSHLTGRKGSFHVVAIAILVQSVALVCSAEPNTAGIPSNGATEAFVGDSGATFESVIGAHAKDGQVVISFANTGYKEFATNLVLTMRFAGVDNYVIVALDSDIYSFFTLHGIPTFLADDADIETDAQYHASDAFQRIMTLRIHYILRALEAGFDVLFTDADAVINRDPFPALRITKKQAMFAYDTPFLPKKGVKDSPLMVMAGFFYMRSCKEHKTNCDLLLGTLQHQRENPHKHDQHCLNQVLSEMPNFDYGLLDPVHFTNGALFFSERLPQMIGVKPAVVQNNWITGTINKVHRFREHLLWHTDSANYYNDPGAKYLVYDNLQPAAMGASGASAALINGLAWARMLNRTLVLPLFCLYAPSPGLYAGSPDWCTVDEFYEINPKVFAIKEHSFMLNPRTPTWLKAAHERPLQITVKVPSSLGYDDADGLEDASIADDDDDEEEEEEEEEAEGGQKKTSTKASDLALTLTAESSDGATDADIKSWTESHPLLQTAAVVRLKNVARQFKGMVLNDADKQAFAHDLRRGLNVREESMRHADELLKAMGGSDNFSCLHLWGGNQSRVLASDVVGAVHVAETLLPNKKQHLYVAMDVMKGEDLEPFRRVFDDATGFEMFPWLTQGLRRHQHTASIHKIVCMKADRFVGDADSAVSREVCARRLALGKHCVEALGRDWNFNQRNLNERPFIPWIDHEAF